MIPVEIVGRVGVSALLGLLLLMPAVPLRPVCTNLKEGSLYHGRGGKYVHISEGIDRKIT